MRTAHQEKHLLLGYLHEAKAHAHLGRMEDVLAVLSQALVQVEVVQASAARAALGLAAEECRDRIVKEHLTETDVRYESRESVKQCEQAILALANDLKLLELLNK
jgi:hypothetical protein